MSGSWTTVRPIGNSNMFRLILLLLSITLTAPADDWPQFRGPNSSGIAPGGPVPIEFGPGKNELWKADAGAGHSSPCIAGKSIYFTSFDVDQKRISVISLDRATGKQRWAHHQPVANLEKGHPSFNPASSSPTSDGEIVVAYFGSWGLICLSHDGKLKWERRMPLTKSFAGNATSPIIAGDRVVLYRGNYVDHFLLAVDHDTGKTLWKIPQAEPFSPELACTACPIVHNNRLIVHSARSLQAFDLASGQQLWMTKCATTATSTPVIAGDEVVVAAWNKMGEPALRPRFPDYETLVSEHDRDGNGTIQRAEFPVIWIFHRPEGQEAPMNGGTIRFQRADTNRDGSIATEEWTAQLKRLEDFRSRYETHGILAVPIDSKGLIPQGKVRTLETQGIPEVPSPLTDGTYVYFVKNGGVLTCLDLKTGKRVYRIRTEGRGTHYASPLIAGNHIYTAAGNGVMSVVTTGPNPKVVATNQLPDGVYASPAAADGVLYVRTHKTLYAFSEPR